MKSLMAVTFLAVKAANFKNLFFGKFAVVPICSTLVFPFRCPEPLKRVRLWREPSFGKSILTILFWRPKKQMSRINAERGVALVANKESLLDKTIIENPRYAVREQCFWLSCKNPSTQSPVTVGCNGSTPKPATIFSGTVVNLFPKYGFNIPNVLFRNVAFDEWIMGLLVVVGWVKDWIRHNVGHSMLCLVAGIRLTPDARCDNTQAV